MFSCQSTISLAFRKYFYFYFFGPSYPPPQAPWGTASAILAEWLSPGQFEPAVNIYLWNYIQISTNFQVSRLVQYHKRQSHPGPAI